MNHSLTRRGTPPGPRGKGAAAARRCRLVAGGALAILALALAVAARRFERLEVVGASMLPVLEPGDRVLVARRGRCRRGDIVALADPSEPGRIVVKRLAGAHPNGGFVVLGDNPRASTDSRHFGPVARKDIHGPVVYRYAPESRRGRLPARSPGERW